MALVPINDMTFSEIVEYVETLEKRVRSLEKQTDNRKKLAQHEVELMRRLYRDGYKNATLADIFQVNPATVSRTVRGIYH